MDAVLGTAGAARLANSPAWKTTMIPFEETNNPHLALYLSLSQLDDISVCIGAFLTTGYILRMLLVINNINILLRNCSACTITLLSGAEGRQHHAR